MLSIWTIISDSYSLSLSSVFGIVELLGLVAKEQLGLDFKYDQYTIYGLILDL